MATLWVNFNNGDTGFAVRTALNTFNTGISTDMSSAETRLTDTETATSGNTSAITALDGRVTTAEADIVALEALTSTHSIDIADNDSRLSILENTGMTVLSGANLVAQSLTGSTPTKVLSFDATAIDVGVGTTGDHTIQRMTADITGVYKLRYESFVSYAANVDIEWQIYKNGVPFGSSLVLAGDGARVFPIVLISSASLIAGDYLELFATASATTNVTVHQANGTLEKTYF